MTDPWKQAGVGKFGLGCGLWSGGDGAHLRKGALRGKISKEGVGLLLLLAMLLPGCWIWPGSACQFLQRVQVRAGDASGAKGKGQAAGLSDSKRMRRGRLWLGNCGSKRGGGMGRKREGPMEEPAQSSAAKRDKRETSGGEATARSLPLPLRTFPDTWAMESNPEEGGQGQQQGWQRVKGEDEVRGKE